MWYYRREIKSEEEKKKVKKSLTAASSAEPRVAFQMRSDTDIIDDGYKWRKYGQKPVKNSRHPRFESCHRHFLSGFRKLPPVPLSFLLK